MPTVIQADHGPVRVITLNRPAARNALSRELIGALYTALTRAIGKYRIVTGRNRHRARKAKCASTFPHASRVDTITRTAAAVITMANNPA